MLSSINIKLHIKMPVWLYTCLFYINNGIYLMLQYILMTFNKFLFAVHCSKQKRVNFTVWSISVIQKCQNLLSNLISPVFCVLPIIQQHYIYTVVLICSCDRSLCIGPLNAFAQRSPQHNCNVLFVLNTMKTENFLCSS